MPSREATITHQAVEYLPHPFRRSEFLRRCWSKWTDGSITHQDSEDTHETWGDAMVIGTRYVNVGLDPDLLPPDGLKWVDTRALLTSS